QLLFATPFPLGVDGYFYPIQVRSILEHGTLQYPASPLTFYFMAPFAAATDPIVGAKLGAALGGALIGLPAYAVGTRFGASRGAGLVAAAVATASASSAYLTIEFVKQGVGLTVGLTALWLLLRALETPSRLRIGLAIGGLCAALLTHKLAAVTVIAIAIPATIEEARGRAKLRGRRLLYLLIALALLAVVALVLGLAFPQRFLSASDIALLGDTLTTSAHWSAPALATEHLTLAFDHEAAIGAVVALAAAVFVWRRPRAAKGHHGERVAMWMVIGFGVAIALPWLAVDDPQGLGFRLRIAGFVPLALNAGIVADALLMRIKRLTKHERDLAATGLALFLAIRPHARPTEGMVLAHPAMVAAVMASAQQIPPGKTVIVPERHILFMVAWYARVPVSLTPDRVPYADRVRMMPLAFIGMESPLDAALDRARNEPGVTPPVGFHPRHRNGLVLVTEPTWEWLLAQLPPAARDYFSRWPTI
ncbi:MAG TPA: glycosyltransferase family 39 protein, partial [Kofleriaceae bacterium]|nr:glycosyltransferase family 39 protein [Kofleriaceae bacterium]